MMTTTRLIWLALCGAWVVSELILAHRSRHTHSRPPPVNVKGGSARGLWWTVVTSVVSALLLKEQHLLPIQLDNLSRQILGFYAFASGLGLRFASVVWLGRFFTVQVAVHDGHYLVATGPFRWIRHPSYAGMLLAFLGVGMAMGDWLALAVLLLPVFTAIRKRIGLEESVLTEFFGAEYVNYAARTKRLIPGVF